jgi:phosphoribosyl-ATP pyrophosphohydrolase
MIELKNIDLSKVNFLQQGDKVIEERKEFTDAAADYLFEKTEENKEHMIEEFCDMVQAGLGLMQKTGIDAKEVMKYYPKHLEKLRIDREVRNDL